MHWFRHYVASCSAKSRRALSKDLVTYRNAPATNENTIRASDHTVCVSVFLTAKRACVELVPVFPFHTPRFHVGGAVRAALTFRCVTTSGRSRAVLHRQDRGPLPVAGAGAHRRRASAGVAPLVPSGWAHWISKPNGGPRTYLAWIIHENIHRIGLAADRSSVGSYSPLLVPKLALRPLQAPYIARRATKYCRSDLTETLVNNPG